MGALCSTGRRSTRIRWDRYTRMSRHTARRRSLQRSRQARRRGGEAHRTLSAIVGVLPLQPAPALEPKHPSEKPKAKGTRLPGAAPEMAAACRPSAPALARSLPPAHRRSRERQRGQAPATARDLRQARQSIRTRPVDESRRPRLGRRRTRPAVPRQIQSRPSRIGNPTARGRRTSRGTPAAARNLFGDQQPATLPTAATSKR